MKNILEFENFINESNNSLILDTVDQIHKTIEELKKDKSLLKSEVDKLYTLAGPFVKQLHKLVK